MSVQYPDLNLTSFPDALDIFPTWLDIIATDGPLIKQYTQAIDEGDFDAANRYLSKIPSGTQKIIKAVDLNKMTQSILALERLYKTDIKEYIENEQKEWELVVNQLTYMGDWSNGTSYLKNNLVTYTIYGVSYLYIAVKNIPTGVPPTDKTYWRSLTLQGNPGDSGQGFSYRGEWKSSVPYTTDDAVTYSGALWAAVKPSQGVTPSQGGTAWKLIMSLAATTYPIQNTQPENQEAGELWFNTQGNPTKFYYLETLQNPATSDDILNGKEVYNEFGERVVGTGSLGGSLEWNSPTSNINWN